MTILWLLYVHFHVSSVFFLSSFTLKNTFHRSRNKVCILLGHCDSFMKTSCRGPNPQPLPGVFNNQVISSTYWFSCSNTFKLSCESQTASDIVFSVRNYPLCTSSTLSGSLCECCIQVNVNTCARLTERLLVHLILEKDSKFTLNRENIHPFIKKKISAFLISL